MTTTNRSIRTTLALALLGLLTLSGPIRADDISESALKRGKTFFNAAKRGKAVINAVHFGCGYNSHTYREYTKVKDSDGDIIPGHFALIYDFKWSNRTGETRIAFFCNQRGTFYQLKILDTNAVFAQPFAGAKLSIKLIGEAILAALKDDLKEDDRKKLRKLIDDADAKGLLEASLQLQQAFGG